MKEFLNRQYKEGFSTLIESETLPAGINEAVIKAISLKKQEPEWLTHWRLEAFRYWQTLSPPEWAVFKTPEIDYQAISYFSAPKKLSSLDEVDPKILETFKKLGIPLGEQSKLAGIAVDAVFDSVSVATTFKEDLKKQGIIFSSFGEAVQNHPELVKKYLGSVVSYKDNFFASLNAAVFTDGSFVYIPNDVKCPMELSTYFRINAEKTGQMERTLIIAEEGAYVSYLEGCFLVNTPIWTPNGIKKIQDIKINDEVFDHNGDRQNVKSLMIRPYKGKIYYIKPVAGQKKIQTTSEHPFWCMKKGISIPKWIEAKNLEEGDFLFMPEININASPIILNELKKMDLSEFYLDQSKGYWIPIDNIYSEYQETTVYNFEVNNTNTYLVNGIAVHNCSAPMKKDTQLHAAVVELVALKNAEIKYSTVQNWYPGDEKGQGGIYNFVTKRGECRGDNSKISWTQIETGSAITWKYPSVVLRGNNSVGEFFSVAVSNHSQIADTGTKMIHLGENTKSTILSKGICAQKGKNAYRGLVRMAPKAKKSRNYTRCDSLVIGKEAQAYALPVIETYCPTAISEHEAFVSKISEEQMFYAQIRGLNEKKAVDLAVNGFCKEILKKLPLEFAVEAQKLLEVALEN